MDYYLQVSENGIITDCISYEVDGYIKYNNTAGRLTYPIHGGWFKLIEGEVIEFPELKPQEVLYET